MEADNIKVVSNKECRKVISDVTCPDGAGVKRPVRERQFSKAITVVVQWCRLASYG